MLRAAIVLIFLASASCAFAHEGKPHKNLKVIDGDLKAIDSGMKKFANEGLGVKCAVCHVKGKWESDEIAAKSDARKFLDAVVGEKDETKKKAALTDLLAALKLDAPKNEAVIWAAVSQWKRKAK